MKFRFIFFFSFLIAEKADLVIQNAYVWTVDLSKPTAEAVAVRNNKIIFVGSNKAVQKYIDGNTNIIDAGGKLVLPGFNDNHVHFESTCRIVTGLNLLDVHQEKPFISRMRDVHERFTPGVWITGGLWSAYQAWESSSISEEGRKAKIDFFKPQRKMVDSFTAERPVFIQRFDRKVFFANSKALEIAGITKDRTDPPNIHVERDKRGNPTGILTGSGVQQYFNNIIPPRSWKQRVWESEAVLKRCARFGVTSLSDMSDARQREIFYYLRNEDKLTVRIHSRGYLDQWEKMSELGIKIGSGDSMIRLGTVKAWIDGIMGNSTARFYKAYSHNSDEFGIWRKIMFPWRSQSGGRDLQSNLEYLAIKADSAGIQLSVHAIGDAANGYLLDMMDRLNEHNGVKNRRFRLVHAQVIRPDDFKRFKNMSIIAEVQPYHCTDDMRWMEERIGHERSKGAYAFRSLWDSGAVVCFGSDSPGTNASRYPLNPMLGLYAAVTRQTLDGNPADGWFPDEKLSVEEAIQAYTLNSAYASFEENIKGSITEGKLADLVILSDNLLEIDPSKIKDVEVKTTIFNGKIIYQQ
jgi:predicted amidohydrolase YtcJ